MLLQICASSRATAVSLAASCWPCRWSLPLTLHCEVMTFEQFQFSYDSRISPPFLDQESQFFKILTHAPSFGDFVSLQPTRVFDGPKAGSTSPDFYISKYNIVFFIFFRLVCGLFQQPSWVFSMRGIRITQSKARSQTFKDIPLAHNMPCLFLLNFTKIELLLQIIL